MNDNSNGSDNGAPDFAQTQSTASLEAQLAQARAEAADFKDRLLRALAEVENVRRRADRERGDAAKYGITQLAKDLLEPADNLRRAVESVPEAQVKDELTRTLLTGVAATERALLAAFERHHIRRIDPKGERFDHNLHQAIFEAERTGQPAGTIVEVLQPGYLLHDRLLRPAMVGVAKGDTAPPPRGSDGDDDRPDPPPLRTDIVV
jgi:molecular chaperone GrpE